MDVSSNEHYFEEIMKLSQNILSCVDEAFEIASKTYTDSPIPPGFCLCSLLNRSIQLTKGFSAMLRDRNSTCAGALLRIQLDNCLRLYALQTANDTTEVIVTLFKGGKINKLKDKHGNTMTDTYLKEQITKIDSQFKKAYEISSGFIHFSDAAIRQTMMLDESTKMVSFNLGGELPGEYNDLLISIGAAFLRFYRLFLHFAKLSAEEYKKEYTEMKAERHQF